MIDKSKWKNTREGDRLVLSSLYLEANKSEPLRKLASQYKVSRGEIIRRLIDIGLHYKTDLHPTAPPGHAPSNKQDIDF